MRCGELLQASNSGTERVGSAVMPTTCVPGRQNVRMQQRLPALRTPPIGFAHRGAKAHAPENTLEAFELALKLGATGLESDVWAGVRPLLDHPLMTWILPGEEPERWPAADGRLLEVRPRMQSSDIHLIRS